MTIDLSTNTRKFLIAQLIGWASFGVFNIVVQLAAGVSVFMVTINTSFALTSGLIVSTIYRYIIRSWKWEDWKLLPLLAFIAFNTLLLAVAWLFLINVLFQLFFPIQVSFSVILANLINGGLVFLVWNLIYFFFKYFSRTQTLAVEQWRMAAEVKEAQLGTLRAQIRPHFVFNTLNNIKALVLEDPQRSREMLINFSDLLRYALQHDEQRLVPLEDEVDISRQYLELMSIQYEERLQWRLDIAPDSLNCRLPPMLLQLLVENAVKHGIAPCTGPGKLAVESKVVAGELQLEVRNSGSLASRHNVEGRLGTGLDNIRSRLRIFYGDRANFRLQEKPPYVIARVEIPQ